MYDVIIIGAGVSGAFIARKLAKYNLKVCVVEKGNDVAMGASKANSGLIHAGFDAKENTLKAKLNVEGAAMMEEIAYELGVPYEKRGALVVGFNEEDKKTITSLYERGLSNGVKELSIVNKEELSKLEANISEEAVCALYAPTAAIICPYLLVIALIGNAMDNGVDLKLNFEVCDIQKSENYYKVYSDKNHIEAKVVINAAGVYADKIANMVNDTSFSIHPRKGEYILLDKGNENLVRHTIFQTPTKLGKGILVTPTIDGNILLGPTAIDNEDKEDATMSMDAFSFIKEKASLSIKNIPYHTMISSFSGIRAVGNTKDFIINSPIPNFINVAAIESPGLSASPAIAEYVFTLLKDCDLSFVEKEGFNPYRKSNHFFNALTIEEKNEYIKKYPKYGKIVCRCENISEQEILDAIHQNPKATTLDGIKRRTRAQMGRCQGGFCTSAIMDLLSKELNISYEQIKKENENSYMVIHPLKKGGRNYD